MKMKNISYSEIDGALSFYELGSNISLFPSIVGFGGGGLAMLGGAGIYMAWRVLHHGWV